MLNAIPFDALRRNFLCAKAVTLFLDTQKNLVRGESITMEVNCLMFDCPVHVVVNRFLYLCDHKVDLDTPICTLYNLLDAPEQSVTSKDLVAILQLWAAKIGARRLGFNLM